MSSRESRAVVRGSAQKRSQSKDRDPPSMSDITHLRIVLVGKSGSENSRVGNFVLGRAAFDSEAPPDVVERVVGRLKDRHVTLINCPQLFQTFISDHQITQTVRECVFLSDPGPHVIVLLLNHEQCSTETQERVEKLLDSFSEQLFQHTMVLSTHDPTETNDILQNIIQKCSNRHFILQRSSSPDDLLQMFEDIVQMNDGRHLVCAQYEASQNLTMKQQATERFSESVKLNVVVCGSDGTLKSSVSELILQETDRRADEELHGRLISLLELPALIRLSEEEVMRQTLRCVSLCHPGVHVFLLIIPDGSLDNENKAEMQEIQRIFSSRINKHIMILIMQNSENQTAGLNEETQAVIECFGGRHHFFGPKTEVSTLTENIEKMLEENRGGFYSTDTFLEAQMEKLMKYDKMKKKGHLVEAHLLPKVSREDTNELRIVLLGETGVGKSATGNTILGRNAFTAEASQESVTKESRRETSEIDGRHVTVIDTPGLFDTELTNEEIQREISNCVSMILPGPHVFIIVLNLGQRFTVHKEMSVKIIQDTFGEKSLMFTMVLFTRGDDLKNKTIDQCLGKPGSPLMKLIEACGNRYHVFNNNQPEDRTQVTDLLQKIDDMLKENGASFYSCKMFSEMEREKQEQQMKILMDRVREREEEMKKLEEDMKTEQETFANEIQKIRQENEKLRSEKEKLQIKHGTITDRLMNQIENERKKREDEFKEREERYKREMKEKEAFTEKMREEMKREREKQKQEKERMEIEKEDLQSKHEAEENKMKILMEKMNREREELMKKHEEEKERNDEEGKAREHEFKEREERYKRLIKDREEKENEMLEQMKLERMQWEKQRLDERQKRDEKKKKEQEKQQSSVSHLSPKEEPPEILKQNPLRRELPTDFDQHTPVSGLSSRRIVLLGKSGVGKSAAGNTILGQKKFRSVKSVRSVTRECSEAHSTVSGRSVSVVDTPGFFDTDMNLKDSFIEIMRSVYLSSPGPHAFLIVLRADERFTKVEKQIHQIIEILFGKEVLKYSIILFTHGDSLGEEPIEDVIKKSNDLRDLVDQCGGRYHVFNNREMNNREQVNELLQKIDTMIEQNGGGHYSNQMFEDAHRFIQAEEERRKQQEEIERMRQETEERIRAERYRDDEKSKPQKTESQQCVCS